VTDQRPTFDRMERPIGRVTLEVTNLSKSLSECTNDPTKLDDRSTWIRGIGRFYQERGTPLSKQTSLMKINGLDGLIRPKIADVLIGRNIDNGQAVLRDNCCSIILSGIKPDDEASLSIFLTEDFLREAENALRVPNVKLIFDLAFTQSLQKFDDHEVKFNDELDKDYLCHWRFDLKCEAPSGMWFGKVWFQEWSITKL
jgi:hypothetical protein